LCLLVLAVILLAPRTAHADDAKVCEASYEHAQELLADKSFDLARAELAVCERACPDALAEDCRRWRKEIPPAPKEDPVSPPIEQPPPPTPSLGTQRVIAIVVGSVGIASLAAGGVLGIVGQVERSNLESECSPACPPERADPIRNEWTAGAILAGTGAALIATGLVLFFTSPEEPAPKRASITLDVSTHGAAAGITIGF
jgi:hypothetical protein